MNMEEIDLIRCYSLDLVSEATGGDSLYIEKLASYEDAITKDRLIKVLQEAGVYFGAILIEDIERIFSECEPIYFIRHEIIAENYRRNYGVDYPQKEYNPTINQLSLACADLERELNKSQKEHELYGVSLASFRRGMACYKEQSFFYQTNEWQSRAKVVRLLDKFACTRCKTRNQELHAHHDEFIYSAYSELFYHNFDTLRIKSFCDQCHKAFHESHIRGYSQFLLASEEERQEEKSLRMKQMELHDLVKECQFCFRS